MILTKYVNELEAPVLEGPVPDDDVLKEIEGMTEDHSCYIRWMVYFLHMYPVTRPTTSVDAHFQEITLPPNLKAIFFTKI